MAQSSVSLTRPFRHRKKGWYYKKPSSVARALPAGPKPVGYPHQLPPLCPIFVRVFTLYNPASSESVPSSAPILVWRFILKNPYPSSPKPVSAFAPILLWRFTLANSGFSKFVPQSPSNIGLIMVTCLLLDATLRAIGISYRVCNSRLIKIWPNNVTAWFRSWRTRDGIANGSPNFMSSERSEGKGGTYRSV